MNNYLEGSEQFPDCPWSKEDDYIELKCDDCNGSGLETNEDNEDKFRCRNCDGEGVILIPRDNKFDVEYDED